MGFRRLFRRLTIGFRRTRRTYALRLAQSGKVNLNKNLACGVACMRLLGGLLLCAKPIIFDNTFGTIISSIKFKIPHLFLFFIIP